MTIEQLITEARLRETELRRAREEDERRKREETKQHYREMLSTHLVDTFGNGVIAQQCCVVVEETFDHYAILTVNGVDVRLYYTQDRSGAAWQIKTPHTMREVRILEYQYNVADRVLCAIADLTGL